MHITAWEALLSINVLLLELVWFLIRWNRDELYPVRNSQLFEFALTAEGCTLPLWVLYVAMCVVHRTLL